jgi:hypothetical protein
MMNKEFISCMWKSSKDLRSKYDIHRLDDRVTLEDAIQLAWEVWREAIKQSEQICMNRSQVCAKEIRSKLLDGTD